MKKSTNNTEVSVITPSTVQNAEFNEKIGSFDQMLLERRQLAKRASEIKATIAELVRNKDDIAFEKGQYVVFKPKSEVDEDAWTIVDSMYGRSLMDTGVDPDVVRVLEKRFKGIAKFLELCHATFQEHHKGRRRSIDEKATAKLRKTLAPLETELSEVNLRLVELETGIRDVEQYVDMFDKIARIGKSVNKSTED